MILNKTKINIKNKIYKANLRSGNKKTIEKNVLKSFKKIQKLSDKQHIKVLELAIKNLTPALKTDKQRMKRKKRKAVREIPTFIRNNFLRINLALKYITNNLKNQSESTQFYNKLSSEIINSAKFDSPSIYQKIDHQNKILLQKNLFFKYRWKK